MHPETPTFQEALPLHKGWSGTETKQTIGSRVVKGYKKWLTRLKEGISRTSVHLVQIILYNRKAESEIYQIYAPRGLLFSNLVKQTGSVYANFLPLFK